MQARDVMSVWPITIHDNATVGDAARLMLEKGASCLPVVDGRGHLVGRHDSLNLIVAESPQQG